MGEIDMTFLCNCSVEVGLLVEMRQLWGKMSPTTLYSEFSEPITEEL